MHLTENAPKPVDTAARPSKATTSLGILSGLPCPRIHQGGVNLGRIIAPIGDMQIKFNLGAPLYDQTTVGRTADKFVDSVSDVITLTADQIKTAPERHGHAGFMLILVDTGKLMSGTEIPLIKKLAA